MENINVCIYGKLQRCYNKCVTIFFGYKRRHSVTGALLDTGLPSLNTFIWNAKSSFDYSASLSDSVLVHAATSDCLFVLLVALPHVANYALFSASFCFKSVSCVYHVCGLSVCSMGLPEIKDFDFILYITRSHQAQA